MAVTSTDIEAIERKVSALRGAVGKSAAADRGSQIVSDPVKGDVTITYTDAEKRACSDARAAALADLKTAVAALSA